LGFFLCTTKGGNDDPGGVTQLMDLAFGITTDSYLRSVANNSLGGQMRNRAAFKGSLPALGPISIALFCLLPLSLPLVRHAVIVLRAHANAHSEEDGPITSLADLRLFDRDDIKRPNLDSKSAARLKEAQEKGQELIPFVLAARRGRTPQVAALLRELGGEIALRADDVDYVRGAIATDAAARLAAHSDVIDISFGEGGSSVPLVDQAEATETPAAHYGPKDFLPAIDPKAVPVGSDPDAVMTSVEPPQKSESTSKVNPIAAQIDSLKQASSVVLGPLNPFLPTYQIGAPQFIRQHPTFDGRGVTIAVIGGVGDLDHPMLTQARLLSGELVSKTVDILDADARSSAKLGGILMSIAPELREISVGKDCTFLSDRQTYFAPAPGRYRFGIVRSDQNDWAKNPSLSKGIALLWDEARNLVWIDSDLDHDFRTETPITDFGLRQQIVRIPGQEAGFTSSLAVKTYPREHILKVYPSTSHETQVVSVAAGNNFMGSQATGVAPAARIVYVVPNTGAEIDAYLFAARDPRVDVITCSQALSDFLEGEDVAAQILNRIVEHYHKLIIRASGNSEGVLGSVYGSACATRVLAIACYSTRASEKVNWASPYIPEEPEFVNYEGGSGPSGLGAVKPDFIAPSPNSRALPCDYMHVARGAFAPVHCYFMGDGQSSMAAPMVAGAVALLISASKQSEIPYDDARIRWALTASARHLSNWPIDRQGGGLIQIGEAWDQLKSASANPPITILSAAKLAVAATYNKTPGYGVGMYEIGWHPGESGERNLALYRTSGPDRPLRYRLSWIENDSTFAVSPEIVLGLKTPSVVPVRIRISDAGIHAALLRISDFDTGRYAAEVGLYIVAAERLDSKTNASTTIQGILSRNRHGRVFVDIPRGTEKLEADLQFVEGTGGLSMWKTGSVETEKLPCSEHPAGRYSLLAPSPGVLQILIFGSADNLDSDNVDRSWPLLMVQQHYKVTLHVSATGHGD
jgi:Subtilase family